MFSKKLNNRVESLLVGKSILDNVTATYFESALLAFIIGSILSYEHFYQFVILFFGLWILVIIVHFTISFKLWKIWRKEIVIETKEQVKKAKERMTGLGLERTKLQDENSKHEEYLEQLEYDLIGLQMEKENSKGLILYDSRVAGEIKSKKRSIEYIEKEIAVADATISEIENEMSELIDAIHTYEILEED